MGNDRRGISGELVVFCFLILVLVTRMCSLCKNFLNCILTTRYIFQDFCYVVKKYRSLKKQVVGLGNAVKLETIIFVEIQMFKSRKCGSMSVVDRMLLLVNMYVCVTHYNSH